MSNDSDRQTILGVDSGPEESALVYFDGVSVLEAENLPNPTTVSRVAYHAGPVAIEDFEPYGVRLGHESMSTIKHIGILGWMAESRGMLISRPEVGQHLCDSRTAKDADVRDALIHRFGPGRKVAVGTKKAPGPLYGISKHKWAALAVAVVAHDRLVQPL